MFIIDTVDATRQLLHAAQRYPAIHLGSTPSQCHKFFQRYQRNNMPLMVNSESTYPLLDKYIPESKIAALTRRFKNKLTFRQDIKSMYPDFYFEQVTVNHLNHLNKVKLPCILKPTIGTSSVGVHKLSTADDLRDIHQKILLDVEKSKQYNQSMVDTKEFMVESWIQGDEYAVDGYYNSVGQVTILNIYKRAFASQDDVSDAIYFTGYQVFNESYQHICAFLNTLGKKMDLVNFSFHIEVRINKDGIYPIEVNPCRFAGAGTADLAWYAYGFNIYSKFAQQEQIDWNKILSKYAKNNNSDIVYGFFIGELPRQGKDDRILDPSKVTIDNNRYQQQIKKHVEILEHRFMPNSSTFAVTFYRGKEEDHQALLNINILPLISSND